MALSIHHELAARGVSPDLVAGHSLGEIAAWSAAGCISPEDAVEIAALRGRAMGREAGRRPGGLLALLDGRDEVVDAALERGRSHGWIAVGAWNAPDEVVLAGDDGALRAVAAAFPSRRLPVTGAWHGPAMEGATEELRAALRAVPTTPGAIPLVCNATGEIVQRWSDVPDLLAAQLTRPIQWARALATLSGAGAGVLVIAGPGAILRGLARKCLGPEARVLTTEDDRDLARTVQASTAARSA